MTDETAGPIEDRVLLLAPTSRDAAAAGKVFATEGIRLTLCGSIGAVCAEIRRGAAVAIVPDEAILNDQAGCLARLLHDQPPWSDFPLIVLIPPHQATAAARGLEAVGHMTLVRRPIEIRSLASTVRAALRDRRRQYARRDDLAERERQAQALRETKDRMAFALEAGGLGSWELDFGTGVLFCSARCKANLGLPADARVVHDALLELIHPEDRARVADAIRRSRDEGVDYEAEYRVVHPDGATHWVLVRGRVDRDDRVGPPRMAGVSLDITGRKNAEEALRASEARLRFLAKLDAALQPLTDPEAITAVAARVLGEHLAVDRCAYAEVDEDEDHFDLIGDYTRGVPSIVGRYALSDFGAEVLRLNRQNQPYVAVDVEAHPQAEPDRAAYRAAAIRAVISVPLHKAGRFVAGMAVHQATPRAWTTEEVELVQGVAGRLWESIERARVARSLRASEERYRTLAQNVPQLFWTCHPDGRCDYLSQQWVDYTGIPEAQQLGLAWLGLVIHPDDQGRAFRAWMAAVEDREPYDLEFRIKGAGGHYRWFKTRGTPIRDADGTIVKWFGTCTDIDAQVRAEEALRLADRKKDEFLAMLAHELRNPLAAVNNAVSVLKLSADESNRAWASDVVARQVWQLTRLIDDLLDVSRIATGKVRLKKEWIDAAAVLDRAAEDIRPTIIERRHQLTASIERGALFVDADPARLEQVVLNLLSNAAKYTEVGGQITLEARRDGDDVVIVVGDNGVGIPPGKLPQMFELFAQGERSLDRSEGGLGIGLTIVKRLTELHGGTISAHSEGVGCGSTFTIRLPAAPPRDGPKPAEVARGPERSVARVLIVDDNVDIARGLARLLTLLGNEVRVAHDGPTAVEAARAFRPESILLDIGLPGMDGYEVAARLRSDARCKDSLIIGISGYGQDDDRLRSKAAGFDHHLVKPVDVDSIVSLIGRPG